MATTRDKVYDAAENVKPYVERAMSDEKLKQDVLSAFATAKELYNELVGSRSAVGLAARVATDDDVRERLKTAVEDLRSASDRLQGRKEHQGRNTTLLVAGIALGILFNPVTGAQTRKWVSDNLFGPSDEFTYEGGNSHSSPGTASNN